MKILTKLNNNQQQNQFTVSNVLKETLSLILVVLLAFCIRIFIFQLYVVPTGSMKATILENDYIFSTQYSYGYSNYSFPFYPDLFKGRVLSSQPERGEIIIFCPPFNLNTKYIKRLIGLPGDKIEIIKDLVYINDKPITRIYVGEYHAENGVIAQQFQETLPNGITYYSYKHLTTRDTTSLQLSDAGPFYVPEGHYFFLGDNRDDSTDSRYGLGFVPFENFVAKAKLIVFSTQKTLFLDHLGIWEQIKRIPLWFNSIRFSRIFTKLQ